MKKMLYDMLYVNKELSQERFNIFIVLIFGLSIGCIALGLKALGKLDQVTEALTYSASLILSALGLKSASSISNSRDAQRYGSPNGTMPTERPKNREE